MLASTVTQAYNAYIGDFPKGPDGHLTPGSLCDHASEYRYPEHIAYCERDVSRTQKQVVFEDYRGLGYRFDPRNRSNFKIDHYIPLCAGGSNHPDNLWPQHVSIYKVTDPIEALGCEKLKEGRITQERLISLIKLVKGNLKEAPSVMQELLALR
jgi:hypothetical protein